MSSSNLTRWSGLAAVLGAALLLLSDLLTLTAGPVDPADAGTVTGAYIADNATRLLAFMLLLVGLVGLYVRQSEVSGTPGLVAFLAAFAGTALVVGASWTNTFVPPALAADAPEFLAAGPTGTLGLGFTLSFALAAVGWLLFGLVSLRARVYPHAAVAVLVVGAALTFVPLPASGAVLEVAIAWLGLVLFSQKEASVRQPERVR